MLGFVLIYNEKISKYALEQVSSKMIYDLTEK